uniref:Uncharacterized protein n=1 Tax=Zea mays TaxID=4577 RepID=B6U484_MAIZE|nr:hypothetical protein [Zea mays]
MVMSSPEASSVGLASFLFPPPAPAALLPRRTMLRRRCVWPRRNDAWANSHRSGSTLRKP